MRRNVTKGLFISLLWFCPLWSFSQDVLGPKKRAVYDIDVRGAALVAATENSIELWNVEKRILIKSVAYSASDVLNAICFSTDTVTAILGTRAGEISSWNLTTGKQNIIQEKGSLGAVTSLDFNESKGLVAAGFAGGAVIVYDVQSSATVFRYDDRKKDATAVRFSPDNTSLASGGADGKLMIHSIEDNSTVVLDNFPNWIRAISFNSDTTLMATASDGGAIRVRRKTELWKNAIDVPGFYESGDMITAMDYHYNDAFCIATGTLSGKVKVTVTRGNYYGNVKSIVNRVKFFSMHDSYFYVVVATSGKGLRILDGLHLKMK